MPSYERTTRIQAPFDAVWEFYSRITGLETVTPEWMALRVESVIAPGGDPEPAVLEAGSEIALSFQPFGVGPRQYSTSVITARERTDTAGYFRDEMVHGPFDRWVHTHAFYADGDETVLRDHVEYELPFGDLGATIAPVSRIGLEPMFRRRHQATRAALE